MEKYHKIQTVYLRDPDNKYKTLLDGQFALPEFEYLANNEWIFTEKIDGCLHYGQHILTEDGSIPIGRIVNQRLPVRVLSYNTGLQRTEYQNILGYHKEPRVRDFLSVCVRSRKKGNRRKFIVCTDNHKFWSGGRWVRAADLQKGQVVSHLVDRLTEETKQVLLGTLLGDGSIIRPSSHTRGICFSHSVKQRSYFDYKMMLLGNLVTQTTSARGGYPGSAETLRAHTTVNTATSELVLEMCDVDSTKRVTQAWCDAMMPLGVAIWYMDDGSMGQSATQRPRARFATNGFSNDECALLVDMLSRFGLDAKIMDYKGPVICLDTDSSARLFSMIAPYVCNSMKYKLPKEYVAWQCALVEMPPIRKGLMDAEVLCVSTTLPKRAMQQQTYQYDLQIEGNSNYFTNNILVHNTNIRVDWDCTRVLFGGRTDNAQIPAFLFARLQELFPAKKLTSLYPETPMTLYGEGYGARIQKGGGNYISDGVNFILFDVMIGNFLNRENVRDIANHLELNTVPIISNGTLVDAVEMARNGFQSQVGIQMAEGLVMRPAVELVSRTGKRIISKIKCKDFARS